MRRGLYLESSAQARISSSGSKVQARLHFFPAVEEPPTNASEVEGALCRVRRCRNAEDFIRL